MRDLSEGDVMRDRTSIDLDNPDVRDLAAHVYLRLYDDDIGDRWGRSRYPEFVERRPKCVAEFSETGVTLEISNSGKTISDAVSIEYKLIFCSASSHGIRDGFNRKHAVEIDSNSVERFQKFTVVAPMDREPVKLKFPKFEGIELVRNIYFRARVSTLWSTSVAMEDWDFKNDPAVTEAYFRRS